MGIKVKTIYPVVLNHKPVLNSKSYFSRTTDGYASFDASSSAETIKFQTWYNANRKSAEPAVLAVDGVYGPLTTAAYQSPTGQMYDATLPAAPIKTGITPPMTTPPTDHLSAQTVALKSPAQPEAPMSMTTKIAIGASIGIGLLVLIILVNKKNRTTVTAHINKIVK